MLSELELAQARDDFEAELLEPRTAKVLRASSTGTATSSAGKITYPDPATVEPIASRLSPMGTLTAGETRVWGEKLVNETGWIVTLPAESDVKPPDRIARGEKMLEVVGTAPGRSWGLTVRVITKELT